MKTVLADAGGPTRSICTGSSAAMAISKSLLISKYPITTIEEKEKSDSDLRTTKKQVQILISDLGSMNQSDKNELAKTMYQEGLYITEKG